MNTVVPISIWPGGMINCFLIKGNKQHILVDTGLPNSEQKIFRQLTALNIRKQDVGLIIITHAHIDHFGSAGKLRQTLGIPVLAHQRDLDAYLAGRADARTLKANKPQWELFKLMIKNQTTMPFTPDILLAGDDGFDLNPWGVDGKVISTPGHTPGSLSVILENGESIIMDMMASGILMGGLVLSSRVKHPPFHHDLATLKGSFEKVLMFKGERYYLGHGGPVSRTQVIRYFEQFLQATH
ncbi:MAG: MBL fold metallo-hydrolase [Bacteroidota bacterium]